MAVIIFITAHVQSYTSAHPHMFNNKVVLLRVQRLGDSLSILVQCDDIIVFTSVAVFTVHMATM